MDVYQRRRLVALSAVVGVFVLVVLIVTGGGDDEEPLTTAEPLPAEPEEPQTLAKGRYIDEADAICSEANSSLEAIDAEDLSAAARSETRVMSSLLQGLRTLPPPRRDSDAATAFLRALRIQVDALRDRQLALDRDDGTALVEVDARLAEAQSEVQSTADEFGFEVCGNPEAGQVGAATADPAAPVDPVPTEPAPEPAPAPDPAPAPGADPDTGGVSPGGGGTGGVSP